MKSRIAGISGCEAGVEYVVAMASNAVLNRKAEEAMQIARLLAGLTDRTEHVYGESRYAAAQAGGRICSVNSCMLRHQSLAAFSSPNAAIAALRS
ncbi:MAG: hypothetical protein ACLGSH_05170 [Acidobacteriota bacterium]